MWKNKKKEKKNWIEKTGWTSELALSNKIEQEFKTNHVELGGFGWDRKEGIQNIIKGTVSSKNTTITTKSVLVNFLSLFGCTMVIWLISTGEVHNYRNVTDKDDKKDTLFSLLSLRVKLYRKDQFTHLSRSYWSLRGKTCAGSGCHLQRKGENRALLNSGILNA